MENQEHRSEPGGNAKHQAAKRQSVVNSQGAPSPDIHVAAPPTSDSGSTKVVIIISSLFIFLGIIIATIVFLKTRDDVYSPPGNNPIICVYNDTLEEHVRFPADGLCDFVIFMSIYYSEGHNTTTRRSGEEQEKGTLEYYVATWKYYHKTAFLAGFPPEYVDEPRMIASRGFAEAIGHFHYTANCKGHGIFYVVSTFTQLESSVPKLRLFFLALAAQMRLMKGDSSFLFFGLTFVDTGGHFPVNETANVIKDIASIVNLVIVRSDIVPIGDCHPQPLSLWQPVRGDPNVTPSTITYSKLIVKSLASLEGTIVAMSSNMALKVYTLTANDDRGAWNISLESSTEGNANGSTMCSTETLSISELCNVTAPEQHAGGKEDSKGAHYEDYTNAENVHFIRTYETQWTIMNAIKSVLNDMPADSKAIFGWTLIDMNYEDSVGGNCSLYTDSTSAFARTKAVRREISKQHRYGVRKLLKSY
ncbi:hypothetical protein MTO96_022154 [Rhipicephalus appendiculatus]